MQFPFVSEMGVRPQALINYITKSGGGFDHQMMSEKRVFKMEELQKMVIRNI